MIKKEFFKEVLNEINTIKTKAFKKEIKNLNFDNFNYDYIDNCLYGQLTGDASSSRAKKIFNKIFYNILKSKSKPFYFKSDWLQKNAKYKYSDLNFDITPYGRYTYLEFYFFICSSNKIKQTIQYLKGEISDIKIN